MPWWPQGEPSSFQGLKGTWIGMEVATVLVGLIVLRFIRFPFLTAPIAFALWYMSMDLSPLYFGADSGWEMRKWVSLVFGALMILVTYFVDRRLKEDYAFWGYLFGLMAFWGGLTSMHSDSEVGKFIYCMINLGLIFGAVFLSRRAFAVFGGIGVFAYVGHLAHSVFKDSIFFPFALSAIGMLVIFLGVAYQKNQAKVEHWLIAALPESLRKLRPTER